MCDQKLAYLHERHENDLKMISQLQDKLFDSKEHFKMQDMCRSLDFEQNLMVSPPSMTLLKSSRFRYALRPFNANLMHMDRQPRDPPKDEIIERLSQELLEVAMQKQRLHDALPKIELAVMMSMFDMKTSILLLV